MPVPVISDVAQGLITTDSALWTLTYPANIAENDLVHFIVGVNGNVTLTSTTSPGWTTQADNGVGQGKRKAPSGGLSGTFDVTINQAEQGCWKTFRVSPWDGTLGSNFTNSDPNGGAVPTFSFTDNTGTAPDPGAGGPFLWDAAKEDPTLYIGICCADNGDTTFSAIPANYTAVGTDQNSGGGAVGAALSVVSRTAAVEPEDMGAWTLSASTLYRAFVMAIRPTSAFTPGVFAFPATHFGPF